MTTTTNKSGARTSSVTRYSWSSGAAGYPKLRQSDDGAVWLDIIA